MFYRLKENGKPVEEFNTLPEFHPAVMATVIESANPPQEDEVWEEGAGWTPEFTEAELLVRAQKAKTSEIERHAEGLIATAYTTPTQGDVAAPVNSDKHRDKMAHRRNAKADKLATGSLTLTAAEKDEAKTDQKLSEHEGKIYTDSDKAVTNMLKLTTSVEVKAFNIEAETWTSWTPPV